MANFTTDGKICIEREIETPKTVDNVENVSYHFDIEETSKWISDNNFTKVCLQFPDELLRISGKVYEELKGKVSADLYILGDTSYASCCVDSVAAMHVDSDAIVHYGRSCFSTTNIPTFIVLPKMQIQIDEVLTVIKSKFETDTSRLCLFYDAEFEYCKDEISKLWFEVYPESYIAYVQKEASEKRFNGRILRNRNSDELSKETLSDCICVYMGSRGQTLFTYTISIAASVWYCMNPATYVIERVDETTWFKRRRYLIEKCRDAVTVGILVCILSGDQTRDIIARLKQLCKVNGKKSYIVSVGKPNVAKLANYPEIDIYVMVACPENDLYTNRDFYKPLVYPFELEVALNTNRPQYFNNHITDFDELLPGKRYYCDIKEPENSTDVSLITGNIREINVKGIQGQSMDLVEKQNWALENIGSNLQDRSWTGLEQKLGETDVKLAEEGRKGISLGYSNEPK